jgi:hypothetical protein
VLESLQAMSLITIMEIVGPVSAGGSDLRDSPMVAQKAGTDAGKQPRVSAIGKVRAQAEKREEAGLAGDNAQDQRSGTDNPLA